MCCFTLSFMEQCPSMVSITKTSFGRSAAESTGSPRSPQVRARGGSEVEWEWLACLPQLMLSASVVMSVRSLLLFLSLLPRSLSSGKAGLLGCFTQTSQNANFQNKHSTAAGRLGVLFARCMSLGKSLTLFGFSFSTKN